MANMIDYNEKVLQVKNLKKYFRVGSGKRKLNIPAVDSVTFDIYKREVFGVVGESGSGKTTLGRTIIKLYQPTDGTVMLNNIAISAGVLGYEEEIRSISHQLKEQIIALNPLKTKEIELKRELNLKLKAFEQERVQVEKEKIQALAEISKQFDQYRASQYQLQALEKIETQKIIFDFNQKVIKTRLQGQNESLLKFKNEVKIANQKYQNKLEGLRDSAALEASTIQSRISQLTQEHENFLVDLKNKYQPQIDSDSKNVLSKQKIQQLIQEYSIEKNQKLSEIKSQYAKKIKTLVKPSKTIYTKDKAKVEQTFAQKLNQIKRQTHIANNEFKQSQLQLPKSAKDAKFDASINNKIKQLKVEATLKIKELKQRIADSKRINYSADTLKESQKMQMIFQDPISSLNPRMTVKEIIGEGLVIQGELSKKEIEKRVAEALQLVGLSPEYASRYPHEFSGGQRQRIGVARALIMNPSVIIADEPISALDVSIRAQVINLLFTLREKLGLTILFIAHDLSVVRFFCDRIAVMFNGKVVEMASSEELFKNPMHPYTISLLSAIPQPDPDYEKNRKRIHYNPRQHNYRTDLPTLREIAPNHLVYANQSEFEEMLTNYKKDSSESSVKKGKA